MAFRFVGDVAQADVILILGSDVPNTTMAQYRDFFSSTSLPAICCNPDKLMLTPSRACNPRRVP